MKMIIFGLGSMGKRRARCLKALGEHEIYGFDLRRDRILEAKSKSIHASHQLADLPLEEADAFFICTPPDKHEEYLKLALEYHKPAFVEASVVLDGLPEINEAAKRAKLFIAPSCTMQFHSAIQKITSWVAGGEFGKVSNFSYHCGQYLPDWHPYEKVSEFYVSNPLTGGAREIVPFELTWIVPTFGLPRNISGFFGQTMDVGAAIDDSYAIALAFEKSYGTMLVDVSSRFGIRHLILNFEEAQVHWQFDEHTIRLYHPKSQSWQVFPLESNYEQMYIDEMSAFLKGMQDPSSFPNTLDKDIEILTLLHKMEGAAHESLSR